MALEFDKDNFPHIPHIDVGNGGNENSENYDSNYAIAQEISSRIGVEPIPFNSVYDIALAIYRELGGEDEGFDSVYSILLGILPLVEGGGSAITEVTILPDAEANKDKIYRLTSDNKIYVAEAVMTTSEEIAPDSEQVGVAYIADDGSIKFYYTGVRCLLHDTYNDIDYYGYKWISEAGDYWIFTVDKAEDITTTELTDIQYYYSESSWTEVDASTYNAENISVMELDYIPATEIYIAKQTLTETTWGWKPSGTSIQSITYAELKSLRDIKQLVPGQQYRITDYVTTNPKKDTIILQILNDEHKPSLYVRYPEGDTDGYFAFTCIKNTYDNGTHADDMSIDINDTWGDESVVLFTTENPRLGNSDVKEDMNYFDVSEKYVRSRQAVQSEEHQFDIIVTADAEDKLNENARAINHPELISAIIIDSESNYLYRRYPEGDDENGYAWAYCVDESSYPTIDEYIDEGFTFSNIDTGDLVYTNSETPTIGSLTIPDDYDIVDFSNTINLDYFANSKLESWELKYCLDNDANRFSWAAASEGNEGLGFAAISVHADDEANATLYKRYPEMDTDGYCAWMFVINSDYLDINSPLVDWTNIGTSREECAFTSTEIPSFGDTMYYLNGDEQIVEDSRWIAEYSRNVQYVEQGKGVIYSMKDEWNNQISFDYKNIKFWDTEDEIYYWFIGWDEYDYTLGGDGRNNIFIGEFTQDVNNILLLPSTYLSENVGYQNIVPVPKDITVEFGITVDASMNPTAITESSTGDYSADDMKSDSFNGAKVHARFAYEVSQGGMTVTVLDYLEGVLNNEKIEVTVGGEVISTEITPIMVFHKSKLGSVWTVWYDNIHSSWKITNNQ